MQRSNRSNELRTSIARAIAPDGAKTWFGRKVILCNVKGCNKPAGIVSDPITAPKKCVTHTKEKM